MWLGVARVSLELTDIGSLKDKRSIVKPIVQKVMNRFHLHAAEVEVHAWTINDPAEMDRLLALGVDGIVTDRADLALAAIDRLADR